MVIVIVGAGGYFGLNAATPAGTSGSTSTTHVVTCSPPSAVYCHKQSTSPNDVILTVPYQAGFGQKIAQVAQGTTVPASLSVSKGETVNSWAVSWGDGLTNTSTNPVISHVYNQLGTFALSGHAYVGTTEHNGTGDYFPIEVGPSITTTTSGQFPVITATFNNGTPLGPSGISNPWVQGSGTVTVSANYTSEPSDTAWVPEAATIVAPGGTITSPTSSTDGASATVALASPGDYQITMVGPIQNVLSHVVIWQNYTWTVLVAPSNQAAGCGSCATSGSNSGKTDPHPGTIDTYEVAPGGATSIDPVVDYESVGYEVIANIYQTLIYYNGSSTTSYLPELATCVPGTAACSSLYGTSLVREQRDDGTAPILDVRDRQERELLRPGAQHLVGRLPHRCDGLDRADGGLRRPSVLRGATGMDPDPVVRQLREPRLGQRLPLPLQHDPPGRAERADRERHPGTVRPLR